MRTLPLAGPLVSAGAVAAGAALSGLGDPALVLVLFVVAALGTAVGARRVDIGARSDEEQVALVRRSSAVGLVAGATIVVVLLALATLV